MLSTLAIGGLLALSASNAPPPDPVAEFVEWAEANGFELLSPACSPTGICFAAVPPGNVVLVWSGGDEGTFYSPTDGSELGASDDTFQVITDLHVNLYFVADGARICDEYLAAEEFGSTTGVGADAIAEIAFGYLIVEFETTWSEMWGGDYRATDEARETFHQRLDECTSATGPGSAASGSEQLVSEAVATAQRVATATADGDWATYRQLRPEPAYTDAELESGYEGLESATVVLASWSATDGGAVDLALGLIAHESRPSGPQTALHCVVWRYFPDSGTILGVEGTANVHVVAGFVHTADLVSRAETECAVAAPADSPAGPATPSPSTTSPPFVVVPGDGMHIEMSGQHATVFDDCANVECTISGASTEMGPVLPAGWWFTDGYWGDGGLYVIATDGTDTTTWVITDIFDPRQWQLSGE